MHFPTSIGRAALAAAIGLAAFVGPAAAGADLAAQESRSDGVTIAVKPVNVEGSAAVWSFKVSLTADGAKVDDDLVRTAYLINRAAGKNVAPTAWQGDAAGGRRREGILAFKSITPQPAAIELRIQRVGEKAPRVFRWDLDCPCNDPKMHPARGGASAPRAT